MLLSRKVFSRFCLLTAISLFIGCEPAVPKNNSAAGKTTSTGTEKAAGGAPSGLKRLIILTNGSDPYWDACRAGVSAADTELALKDQGLVAVLENPDGTIQGQITKLQQYGTQSDIAGVGVSPVDSKNSAIADELRSLQKKGIKILTIDSDMDRAQFSDVRYAFIGTDNLIGGKVLGTCAKGLRPEGGEYVTFVGMKGAETAVGRISGFAEGAGEKFVSKDDMTDEWDKAKARDNVRNAINNHPNLKVLVGIWAYNAPAIVDVLKESNRRKDFTIVTFDADPSAITSMAEGNIDAMVVQNPFEMGFLGIKALAALVTDKKEVISEMFPNFGKPNGDILDTSLKVVVPNTGTPLKSEMFHTKVEFTTLDQFQQWLKKYGLTGS